MAKRTPKTENREELFVASYLAHGNATQAAKDSGYSAKSAHAKGNELLKRPTVAAAITAGRARIVKKFKVTAERVVEEMAVIAFSDIRNYRMTDDGHVELVADVDSSAGRAIKRIRRRLRLLPQKPSEANPMGAPITEVESEIEIWNKDGELRALGEYLKLFKENRADETTDDDNVLTPAQREERITALLRKAVLRKNQRSRQVAGSRKKAG